MFDLTEFNSKVAKVNKHLSRFLQSSLEPLQRDLARLNGAPTALQRAAIQEHVFCIPYDRQLKYYDALSYLATQTGVVICGRPADPVMALAYFRANEYLYVGQDEQGGDVLSSEFPGAIPVKSFHHVFDLTYKSSTGNMQSLKDVGTREHVKFRTVPGAAPFNDSMADTPMEFFHGVSTSGADSGVGRDDHFTKPPSLVCREPWSTGELVADQWYQYTIDGGKTWANIPGAAYNLIKGVRLNTRKQWVFYFIKQNWAPHNRKDFRFEVEYLLHSPVPPPKVGAKLGKADSGTGTANLHDHASRVVRMR